MADRRSRWTGGAVAGLLLILSASPAHSQELPVTVRGQIVTGFYYNDLPGKERDTTAIPLTLRFNLSGYLGHPDFMTYSVIPKLSTGQRIGAEGFNETDSIGYHASFFRRRAFPFALSYREASADGLPLGNNTNSLRPSQSSRDKSFNYTQRLVLPKLPRMSYTYDRSTTRVNVLEDALLSSGNRTESYGIQLDNQDWGWNWQGGFSKNRFRPMRTGDEILAPFVRGVERENTLLQLRANRPFWRDGRIRVDVGERKDQFGTSQSLFQAINRFANAQLSTRPWERLGVAFSTSYNSSLLARTLQTLLAPAAGNAIGPLQTGTLPDAQARGFSVSGGASYLLHRDWAVKGSVARSRAFAPDRGLDTADASSVSLGSGLTYQHGYSWARLTASYALAHTELTRFALTQSSRNHSFNLQANRGTEETLLLEGRLNYAQGTRQAIDIITADSLSTSLSAVRRVAGLRLRGEVQVQDSKSRDGSTTLRDSLRFSFGVRDRWWSASYSTFSSDSLRVLFGTLENVSDPLLIGAPLHLIPHSSRTQTLQAHANFTPRLSTSLLWTRAMVSTDSLAENEAEQVQVRMNYRFRLLELQGGFIQLSAAMLKQPRATRTSIFLRVVRRFRIF